VDAQKNALYQAAAIEEQVLERQEQSIAVYLKILEIDGEDLELYRSSPLHIKQQIEHRVTVLSARETDHDLVAVLDHAEVADCSTEFFQQLSFGLGLYKQLFDPPPKRQIFACQYSFNKS